MHLHARLGSLRPQLALGRPSENRPALNDDLDWPTGEETPEADAIVSGGGTATPIDAIAPGTPAGDAVCSELVARPDLYTVHMTLVHDSVGDNKLMSVSAGAGQRLKGDDLVVSVHAVECVRPCGTFFAFVIVRMWSALMFKP